MNLRSRPARLALASLLALVLAAWLAWREGGSIESTLAAARQLPWLLVAGVFGLSLLNYLLRYLRWEGLIGTAGSAIPRRRHLLIYLGGFSLTLTPAKAGEALRAVYLLPHGVTAQHSLSCLAVERVLDVAAVAILASLALNFWPAGWFFVAPSLGGAALSFGGLLWMAQRPVPVTVPVWVPDRIGTIVVSLLRSLGGFGAATIFRAIPLSVAGWGLEAIGLILLVHHFSADISALLIVGIFGASVLGGALTFLPGGLGGTELLMVALLTAAGLGGAEAAAVTTVCRLATLWFGFALGLLALPLLGTRAPTAGS